MSWYNTSKISSKKYICGHCGNNIASDRGYYNNSTGDYIKGYIYICHHCNKPTLFDSDGQVPGALHGKAFDEKIFNGDIEIFDLYNEARKNMMVNSYTSVGMCCRKLLMNIAVNCGADEDKTFKYYVEYLDDENYIPVNSKVWVDIIRDKGNEANHEIKSLTFNEAMTLLKFIETLINIIYEMPYDAQNVQ